MRLAVFGAGGRMGQAVIRVAEEAGHSVVYASNSAESGTLDKLGANGAQAAIDFSHASVFAEVVRACVDAKLPLASGTTGFDTAGQQTLNEAARTIPIVWEPNMSVGVFVLSALVREAALQLGESFDVEIVEAHHKNKADAPSGTALRLAEAVRSARADLELCHGRHGASAKRTANELGMHAVRGGSVVGDHRVAFLGESERLELTHHAENRDVFARGALRAAVWLAGREAGRYGLGDVLRT